MKQAVPSMKLADNFVSATLKGFLIIFGLATCLPILEAYNFNFANERLFSGATDEYECGSG